MIKFHYKKLFWGEIIMKKLLLTAFAALMSLGMAVSVYADGEEDFEINYGCIVGYSGDDEDISIPIEVNGETVTSVYAGAFDGNMEIKSIFIPRTVTDIRGYRPGAHDPLRKKESAAFTNLPNLEQITVDEENPRYCDIDGVLIDKDENRLVHYPISKHGLQYTIPEGIESVADYAFSGVGELRDLYVYDDNVVFDYNAIDGDLKDKITINCNEGSRAETYAKIRKLKAEYMEVEPADDDGINAAGTEPILDRLINFVFAGCNDACKAALDVDGSGAVTVRDCAEVLQRTLD